MKTTIFKFAAVAIIAVGPAMAGSVTPPVVDPVVTPPVADSDWTGFYVGGHWLTGSSSADFPIGASTYTVDLDHSGYGIKAGYLHDLGKLVVGGELSYEWVDVDTYSDQFTRAGIDAVIGYDAGKVLPHITLGVAQLDTPVVPDSQTGWAVGVGASVMVSEHVMLTGRYRQTFYTDDYLGWPDAKMNAGTFTLSAAYSF